MQTTFTLRPTPNLKNSYDIFANGQHVASVMSRAGAKMILRQYQLGIRQVRVADEVGTHGRCDSCGSPCDSDGCTADRHHEIANV